MPAAWAYQLRMNHGGTYLEQVRQAVAILEEAHDGEATDSPTRTGGTADDTVRRRGPSVLTLDDLDTNVCRP